MRSRPRRNEGLCESNANLKRQSASEGVHEKAVNGETGHEKGKNISGRLSPVDDAARTGGGRCKFLDPGSSGSARAPMTETRMTPEPTRPILRTGNQEGGGDHLPRP